MSTRQSTLDFILDHLTEAQKVTSRKMFGEYAIYVGGKVVALVCDDQLFIKPTTSGKTKIGEPHEAPPYPGAKKYFLIDDDRIEDTEWLSELVMITAAELPPPKPKKNRRV
jgi:DNA transformation protein and related proteins